MEERRHLTSNELRDELIVAGAGYIRITTFGDAPHPARWNNALFYYRDAEFRLEPEREGLMRLSATFDSAPRWQMLTSLRDLDVDVEELVSSFRTEHRLGPRPQNSLKSGIALRLQQRDEHLDNNDVAAVERAFDADPHDPRLTIAGLYAAAWLELLRLGARATERCLRPDVNPPYVSETTQYLKLDPPHACESCGNVMLKRERYMCGYCKHVHPMVRHI